MSLSVQLFFPIFLFTDVEKPQKEGLGSRYKCVLSS